MADVFDKNLEQIRKMANNPLFDLIQVPDNLVEEDKFDQPRFLEDSSLLEDDFLKELRERLFGLQADETLTAEESIPLASRIGFTRMMKRTVHDLRRSRVQMAADHAGEMRGIASSNGTLSLRVDTGAKLYPPQQLEKELLRKETTAEAQGS